ncbi:uncharacterized protein BBOV_IV004655 [Babesia bovis T2Bo]|uniref:Signal peptide-containing protein n=1 Tax=Babesia bovis TaxID=5865 RepID=S6BHP4_BABBO|nr:uncharacterized protein BBOV_IV004655 [Babesia bovis T2Bo]KAG6439957.1 hypothetical protein BBOV_IV004655 [Babesia bovis T2Bo]BAN65719.1 signal peptide-containing protein [Babesia bovis]
MNFLNSTWLCYFALGLLWIHGSRGANFPRLSHETVRNTHAQLFRISPNVIQPGCVNKNLSLKTVIPANIYLCSIRLDEQTGKCDIYPFALVRDIYNKVRDLLSSKLQKIQQNRKDAFNSTHPLRHQKWVITLQKKRGFFGLKYQTEQIVIDFMDNGVLKTQQGQNGIWWYEYGNINWKIYMDPSVNVATYFTAQFCWNNFGKSAFMRRGVVYQDRPPNGWLPQYLFRPVVAKFTGEGIV